MLSRHTWRDWLRETGNYSTIGRNCEYRQLVKTLRSLNEASRSLVPSVFSSSVQMHVTTDYLEKLWSNSVAGLWPVSSMCGVSKVGDKFLMISQAAIRAIQSIILFGSVTAIASEVTLCNGPLGCVPVIREA